MSASLVLNTVTIQMAAGNLVDHSGTITTANTAQVLIAANTQRRGWRIQNNGTQDLWFNDTGGTAVAGGAGCYRVGAGVVFETQLFCVGSSIIRVVGEVAGQAFSAAEW